MILALLLLACPIFGCPQAGSADEVSFSWTTALYGLNPVTCEADSASPFPVTAVRIWARFDPAESFVLIDSLAAGPGRRMAYTLPVPALAGTVEVSVEQLGLEGQEYQSSGVCPIPETLSLPFDHRTPADPTFRKRTP